MLLAAGPEWFVSSFQATEYEEVKICNVFILFKRNLQKYQSECNILHKYSITFGDIYSDWCTNVYMHRQSPVAF